VSLPPRGIPPPFTFSNSSIVRARALISFIFAIILLFLIVILTVFSLVAQTLFVLIDDAKLRRFSSDSKKFLHFFSNLYGQTPALWPNRGNRFKKCPKAHVTECPDPSVSRLKPSSPGSTVRENCAVIGWRIEKTQILFGFLLAYSYLCNMTTKNLYTTIGLLTRKTLVIKQLPPQFVKIG
jgi:hypothetical protein